jgi:hypothetical protein
MRWIGVPALLGLASVLPACSSGGVVGQWESDSFAGPAGPDRAQSMTLQVDEDQTFTAKARTETGFPVAAYTGTWEPAGGTRIRFESYGEGPNTTARLIDGNTLQFSGPQLEGTFARSWW